VGPPAAVRGNADPGSGGCRTFRVDRQYRSRLEILRDFLTATRDAGRKTRIIGLANLNPTSFRDYLEYSIALGLVQDTSGGYRLTPRADVVLDAIQRLLVRTAEVDAALLDLQRGLEGLPSAAPSAPGTLRFVSRIAWNEIARSASGAYSNLDGPRARSASVELDSVALPSWFVRGDPPESEGPVLSPERPAPTAPVPRRRPMRSRSRS